MAAGINAGGSSYLRNMNANQQFDQSNEEDNWDESVESDPDPDFS